MSKNRIFEKLYFKELEDLFENHFLFESKEDKFICKVETIKCAAAFLGGFDPEIYKDLKNVIINEPGNYFRQLAMKLCEKLKRLKIHPSVSLAYLLRENNGSVENKEKGIYPTDFRLAFYLAEQFDNFPDLYFELLDPSCGSGTLLAVATIVLSKKTNKNFDEILQNSIFGADLSESFIQSTLISLASFTKENNTLHALDKHLKTGDSLLCGKDLWRDLSPEGFKYIIANPPWGKIKLSQHNWLLKKGETRHYGSEYNIIKKGHEELIKDKNLLKDYINSLSDFYHFQGNGDHDYYKYFLELCLNLISNEGEISILLPAGLIRAQGAKILRKELLEKYKKFDITIFDNKANFFDIDTRFKFLAISVKKGNRFENRPLILKWGKGTDKEITVLDKCKLERNILLNKNDDILIPEVKSDNEWKVFKDFREKGIFFTSPDNFWQPEFHRELDMTFDKDDFLKEPSERTIPIIEGRMVHQYRYNFKNYISGTGRKAIWAVNTDCNSRKIKPQFYYSLKDVSLETMKIVLTPRVGFCDITGQTNERSLLASFIPENVICGNKVPTITFNPSITTDLKYCWLAIVNSFTFDWIIRRIITTSVNFFILANAPFPKIELNSINFKELHKLAYRLSNTILDKNEIAKLRSEIEWRVLSLYDHDASTMKLLFLDFPLLDKKQPPINNEKRSTITRDFVLLDTIRNLGGLSKNEENILEERVLIAQNRGSIPFIN